METPTYSRNSDGHLSRHIAKWIVRRAAIAASVADLRVRDT